MSSAPSPRRLPRAKPLSASAAPPAAASPAAPQPRPHPASAPGQPALIRADHDPLDPLARVSKQRKKSPLFSAPVLVGLVGGVAVLGLLGWMAMPGLPLSLKLLPIEPQTIEEQTVLFLSPQVEEAEAWRGSLVWKLVEGPEGARIDDSGEVTWKPTEAQGPGRYDITLRVASRGGDLSDEQTFSVEVQEVPRPPLFTRIPDQTVAAGGSLELTVNAADPDIPASEVRYHFSGQPPEAASLDPQTGQLRWQAPAEPSREPITITVRAEKENNPALFAEQSFRVRVVPNTPGRPVETPLIDQLAQQLTAQGAQVRVLRTTRNFLPLRGVPKAMYVDGHRVYALEYPDSATLAADLKQISPDGHAIGGTPQNWRETAHFYRGDRVLVIFDGDDDGVLGRLAQSLGRPLLESSAEPGSVASALPGLPPMPTTPAPTLPADPGTTTTTPEAPYGLDTIRDLHRKNRLVHKTQYATLREIFAKRFELAHQEEIRQAFDGPLLEWLEQNKEIKEELYCALHPEHDRIGAALELFAELHRLHGDKLKTHADLAIAVAVTWDGTPGGVYEYRNHQRRCKAILPEKLVGARENFEYLLNTDSGKYLPWEFLIYVVNHPTPLDERQWAVTNYLPRRQMIGQCYHDCPYDDEMLRTGSAVARLNDKEYTLRNLKVYGGVCAMQADFASRVGKSLGIPAVYVWGESVYNDLHAWVCWVELKAVSASQIQFSLESHGRYRGDKYYVGHLNHPQTGQEITDRQMELELQTVGLNTQAKRQADLIMRAYPELRDAENFSTRDELNFLAAVTRLCPGNTPAWRSIAALSKEGKVDRADVKTVKTAVDQMFATFKNCPDFTWEVFGDLIAFEESLSARISLYEKLVALYVAAGRADLASQAQLVVADLLAEDKRIKAAIEAVIATIRAFPDAGRYVPRLIDKLEQLAGPLEGGPELIDAFWKGYLPVIPKRRGNEPSQYCIRMHERAAEWFTQRQQIELAGAIRSEANRLKQPN